MRRYKKKECGGLKEFNYHYHIYLLLTFYYDSGTVLGAQQALFHLICTNG